MIQNYLKLAYRNLLQNKLYSVINIAGLAIALATVIMIVLRIEHTISYNRFHRNLSDLYVILGNQEHGGDRFTVESLPGPLADAFRREIPEIKTAFRFSWQSRHLMSMGEKNTFERGFYAEPDLFSAMHFDILAGDPYSALTDGMSVVVTERTALKFFGSAQEALGKTFKHNNNRELRIGAVVQNIPERSTMQFDIVLPFRLYEAENADWINISWANNALATWVELHPGTNIAALNAKLENFVQQKDPYAAAHVFVYPLERWHLYNKFKDGKPSGGRMVGVILMGCIGLLVLLIACANFMNLATARSERKAREVGIRKAVGAQRSLIIGQFLSEAMIMTLLSLFLSIVAVKTALPFFNRLTESHFQLSWNNFALWGSILAIGLATGLLAGSYPAYYLSKFQPLQVLRGNAFVSASSGGRFRKILVTFQFVISIFLIISTIVITRQLDFTQNRPLGYDQECLINIPVRGDMNDRYDAFRDAVLQIPGVRNISAGSDNLVRFGSNTSSVHWPGKTDDQDFLVSLTWVRSDWVNAAGLRIAAGRDFSSPGDSMCCLLNEAAVRRMGLGDKAVGTVLMHDTTVTVIGVVEDFVFNDPFAEPRSLLIYPGRDGMENFFIRFENSGNWNQILAKIEAAARKINPAYPFEFSFTKDDYQKSFNEAKSAGQLGKIFGGIAVFISCLGLFGLSTFVAERRKKEIGVRKVLGASVLSVWVFISGEFLKPVLWAFLVAAPLAAWAMSRLLDTMEYRIELSWWFFAIAGVMAFLIALLTVSFQSIGAARSNPVHALRSE